MTLRQSLYRIISSAGGAGVIDFNISGQSQYDSRRYVLGNPITIANATRLRSINTTGTKADVLMYNMPKLVNVNLGTPSALMITNCNRLDL